MDRRCRRFLLAAACAVLLLAAAGCKKQSPAPPKSGEAPRLKGELTVYVPCSIGGPFFNILDRYREEHPGVTIEFDSGNSVVLERKVLHKGERPDVYIGTGPLEFDPLETAGLLLPGSRRALSTDTVLLTVPKGNPAGIRSVQDLVTRDLNLIAMPDPKINSSGKYAVEAFRKLGVWEKIKGKVRYSEFGKEARKWVMDGKADAGIMYRSCLYEDLQPGDEVRAPDKIVIVADLLAEAGMDELITPGGVLKESRNPDLARHFLDYLTTPASQKTIREWQVVRAKMVQGARVPLQPRAPKAAAPAVTVVAYYPLNEEHRFIADYIHSLPAKFGRRVKVEAVDFRSPEGYKRWRASGLTCGGVLLNGKYAVEITVDGKKKPVRFLRRMGVDWEKEDLEAAIRQILESAPGGEQAAK